MIIHGHPWQTVIIRSCLIVTVFIVYQIFCLTPISTTRTFLFIKKNFKNFQKFFWKFKFFYQKIEFFVNIDLAELYTPYKTFISNVPTQYYQNSQLFEWLKKMIFSVKHDHLSFKIHYDFIKQIISSFIL